jgi:uncharacterized protein YndB with AHSA1/START domain
VKRLRLTRDIAAPASAVWALLTDIERWPDWGPTVRAGELPGPGPLSAGSRGRVQTAVGLWLPFEVTHFEEGRAWAWEVAGIPATDHTVEPVDDGRCRASFGVPWPAAPYLGVCRLALRRLEELTRPG